MQKKFFQVAIDGPVAAGKGTAAKKVALALKFLYVDTGAMYRAATWLLMAKKMTIDEAHEAQLLEVLDKVDFGLVNQTDEAGNFFTQVLLDGRDVSSLIRTPQIDANVSTTATLPLVRAMLVAKQQALASANSVVMEGRDIGTKVLPAADVKFFLTASLEVRASRRFATLALSHPEMTLQDVRAQILERDRIDTHRATDPLVKADDAILVDTSDDSIEETVAKMLSVIHQKLPVA